MGSLQNRIFFGFLFVFLLLVSFSAIVFYQFREVQHLSNRIDTLRWPTTEASQGMRSGIHKSLASLRGWLILRNPEFKQERREAWNEIDSYSRVMNKVSEKWTNPENNIRLEKIKPLIEDFREFQNEVELTSKIDIKNANQLLGEKAAPTAKKILQYLDEMAENQKLLILNDTTALVANVENSRVVLLSALVTMALFLIFFGHMLVKDVTVPVSKAAAIATRIAGRDLETKVIIKGPTEMRQLGVALEKMRDGLKNNLDELQQFSYRTSHDLKAPIVTTKRFAKYIEKDIENGDYDEAKRNASEIAKRMEALESLISNILKLARADLDDDKKEGIWFSNLITDIRADLAGTLDGVDIHFQDEIEQHQAFLGHKARFYQIFSNLIGNAIKYRNREREAMVRIHIDDKGDKLKILVEDNGLGFPIEKQKEAFRPFKRFHTNSGPGTGLGLAIVKKNTQRMGGSIEFESSSKGTKFHLAFPKEAQHG